MNKSFLESIGINAEDDLAVILEHLEEKQLEYFERLENVSDSKREEELQQILAKIEKETENVKEELNAVKTAIIFDDPADKKKEQNVNKGKKTQAQKEKKEALKKNIEEMKSRTQKKEEKKAEKKAEAKKAESTDNHQEKTAAAANQTAEKKPEEKPKTKPEESQLTRALQNYQKGEYKLAFKQFTDLGEKKNDPVGQLMLARMYEKGEGTPANIDRAMFWYKSSADKGNADAQYAYAIQMLAKKQGTADNSDTKIGMSYMEKAAEQNYQAAIDRYIELSLQDGVNTHWISKAIGYCDRGANLEQGAYEKEQYKRKKKELENKRKSINKVKNAGTVPTVLSIVGSILYVVSFVYMFWGLHPYYTAQVEWFSKLPAVTEKYIIPWQKLRDWAAMDGFLSMNGIFAMELLVIAAALTTIGSVASRKKIARNISKLVPWAAVAMAIWHIYVWHTMTEFLTKFAVKSGIAFFAPILIGYIIGNIVKSISKVK